MQMHLKKNENVTLAKLTAIVYTGRQFRRDGPMQDSCSAVKKHYMEARKQQLSVGSLMKETINNPIGLKPV